LVAFADGVLAPVATAAADMARTGCATAVHLTFPALPKAVQIDW